MEKTTLLCKTHYFKRFREGGSYLGGEKFAVKAVRDIQAEAKSNNGRNTPVDQIARSRSSTEEPIVA